MKPIIFAIVALSTIWVVQTHAQPSHPTLNSTDVRSYCPAFTHSGDGAWIADKQVVLQRPTGRLILMKGAKVVSGKPLGGMDLGVALDVQCAKRPGA